MPFFAFLKAWDIASTRASLPATSPPSSSPVKAMATTLLYTQATVLGYCRGHILFSLTDPCDNLSPPSVLQPTP